MKRTELHKTSGKLAWLWRMLPQPPNRNPGKSNALLLQKKQVSSHVFCNITKSSTAEVR